MAAIPDVDATLVVAKNFISKFLPGIIPGCSAQAVITQEGRPDGLSFCDMKGANYD